VSTMRASVENFVRQFCPSYASISSYTFSTTVDVIVVVYLLLMSHWRVELYSLI
jgi:hypothetical protein